MITFTEQVTLVQVNCGHCGGTYAINERYKQQRNEQGGGWHCPYCECSWGYFTSENQRLKKELEDSKNQLRASKCETLSERNLRESAEKKLRRVDAGVCPHCRRTFTNLARHMACKHKPKAKSEALAK